MLVNAQLVGDIFRAARDQAGMTQEVLSGLAGLDRTHYSKIERGLRNPTIDTLFKVANALDIKPHILVKHIEDALEAKDGEAPSR